MRAVATPLISCTLLLLLLAGPQVDAASYFVASWGNNNNNTGTLASSPWLDSTNFFAPNPSNPSKPYYTSRLNSGDVVNFMRGSYWPNTQFNLPAMSGVSYVAYGTGDMPVIGGALRIESSSWRAAGSGWPANAWKYNIGLNKRVNSLFYQDQRQILARFPNYDPQEKTGMFFAINVTTNFAAFTSSVTVATSVGTNNGPFPLTANAWNNATLRVRINNWNAAVVSVTSYSWNTSLQAAQMTFSAGITNAATWRWSAAYVEGLVSMFDAAGEFFYDSTSGYLYYIPPHSGAPRTDVYVPLQTAGLMFQVSTQYPYQVQNVLVSGIGTWRSQYAGLVTSSNAMYFNNLTISRCSMVGHYAVGIYLTCYNNFYTNCTVYNNYVNDTMGDGISLNRVNYMQAYNNHISNIMTRPLETASGFNAFGLGHYLGDNNEYAYNLVDTTGYTGIQIARGNNIYVHHNNVSNSNWQFSDGGGIYGTPNFSTFSYNRVSQVNGKTANSYDQAAGANGIYMDVGAVSNEFSYNTFDTISGFGIKISLKAGSAYNNTFYCNQFAPSMATGLGMTNKNLQINGTVIMYNYFVGKQGESMIYTDNSIQQSVVTRNTYCYLGVPTNRVFPFIWKSVGYTNAAAYFNQSGVDANSTCTYANKTSQCPAMPACPATMPSSPGLRPLYTRAGWQLPSSYQMAGMTTFQKAYNPYGTGKDSTSSAAHHPSILLSLYNWLLYELSYSAMGRLCGQRDN
eukprot:TRINITY_DN7363_c0_g1_i3.p1 TRINITY_DN7363_c0_g1~~TRINITY_DN7363_c0_g1_i3.p1  ORF type:complete len:738 (+),score=119.90 TRINITY_DN7363_c0_g1_i3:579-2792(+)